MSETIMQKRLKRWFKVRFAVLYPLGFWVLLTCYSTDDSLMRSLWFILAGLGIRTWANGYAIKMDRLTTCGPYAYLRHPLYLGSFLILCGFLLMFRVNWIIVLFILAVIVGLIYRSTVRHEEAMLKNKFGESYSHYKTHVLAFFPWFPAYHGVEQWPWSFERYIKSQEYKIPIWMIVLIIVFYLKGEFLAEHETFAFKHGILISVAFLLGCVDLYAEYRRKHAVHQPPRPAH